MESVELLVAHIQGLSGSVGHIFQLHNLLKKAEESLQSQASRLAPFLEQLDPSNHSLGYLYILEAYTSVPVQKEKVSEIALSTLNFINSCLAEQIQLVPAKFTSLCKRLKDQVLLLQSPIQGVGPLRTAVRKLQPSSEHLTALHPDFLQLCLLSKCYKAGRCVLEEDIFEVDQPKDFFLYCYYGGMICIGHKLFHKAMELLHNVVTAPMSATNAIAVEAYKKYILVSLIHNGQFATTSFTKYTSSVAQRSLKNFSLPYVDLANSYGTGKIAELESCAETNREKFELDNTFGLVKQVVSSLYKRNIQRLTQTYLTLSLQFIANTV